MFTSKVRLAFPIACVAIAFAGQGVGAQYDYHRTTAEIVWRGTQALKLCNGLFLSNRTADQIYAQEFAGMGEPMRRSRVEIDTARKTVAIGVGTPDAIPAMRAAFR